LSRVSDLRPDAWCRLELGEAACDEIDHPENEFVSFGARGDGWRMLQWEILNLVPNGVLSAHCLAGPNPGRAHGNRNVVTETNCRIPKP
jgi:hypothetical protein